MTRFVFIFIVAAMVAGPVLAAPDGTRVLPTAHTFNVLVQRLQQAIADNGMGLVSQASASAGAARRGVTIPGNYVAGVFRNDFAVRMLAASVAAGIEAPIRFYITENADGSASLSYKTPSAVFAPYEGGPELQALGAELDVLFANIAAAAVGG